MIVKKFKDVSKVQVLEAEKIAFFKRVDQEIIVKDIVEAIGEFRFAFEKL